MILRAKTRLNSHITQDFEEKGMNKREIEQKVKDFRELVQILGGTA
jgi:hypothetical protein